VQTGIAVHSSGELGIQLATMLHLGATLPNLTFAADAHYHHLTDDVITGGKLKYENGAIRVPAGPGLGVRLDRDKVEMYAELYRRLGGYPYDRDPARLGWLRLLVRRNCRPCAVNAPVRDQDRVQSTQAPRFAVACAGKAGSSKGSDQNNGRQI
jgi:glucarate dehydratase